jgi:Recombinase/Resolvase, N terminal domain
MPVVLMRVFPQSTGGLTRSNDVRISFFDVHGVSFVSVTQSFNTTTSMGRLTLNMLLSFAQFEREVTGERIRDKLAASKRRGIWVGGIVPLGYEVRERKLLVREDEAQTIRLIFERYLALGSLPALQRDLRERGVVTRRRSLSSGRIIGGVPLTNGPLAHILRNRVYLGELNHKGASYPGEHAAIVDRAVFDAVQEKLTANRNGAKVEACCLRRPSDRPHLRRPRPPDDAEHGQEGQHPLSLLRLIDACPRPQERGRSDRAGLGTRD